MPAKSALRAMQAVNAMKAMKAKKTMKDMGHGQFIRRQVMEGVHPYTESGLRQGDLVKGKNGKSVSAKASANGKASPWIAAVAAARNHRGAYMLTSDPGAGTMDRSPMDCRRCSTLRASCCWRIDPMEHPKLELDAISYEEIDGTYFYIIP